MHEPACVIKARHARAGVRLGGGRGVFLFLLSLSPSVYGSKVRESSYAHAPCRVERKLENIIWGPPSDKLPSSPTWLQELAAGVHFLSQVPRKLFLVVQPAAKY